jgi:hypothetical protein
MDSFAAARLHHVNVDRLLFLYQASSGDYQGSSIYVPFPSSAACGSNTEQCGYTYEARVPRASMNAFSFNSSTSGVSAAATSYVSDSDEASQATTGDQHAYEMQERMHPSDETAVEDVDVSRLVVANSVVERFVAEEDTAGGHIGGNPASKQAREYLQRYVLHSCRHDLWHLQRGVGMYSATVVGTIFVVLCLSFGFLSMSGLHLEASW